MERLLDLPISAHEWEGTTDILLNQAREAWVDRPGGLQRIPLPWSETDYRNWVLKQLANAGTSWDAKRPYVDAMLSGGWRLHVVFPPASRTEILVSLRRTVPRGASGRDRWGPSFDFLVGCSRSYASLLIAGATGSGKTTLLNDLLSALPNSDRILALEDTPELAPHHPHFVSLVARPPNAEGFGEITTRDLLKQTLRMRPDRLVLGECRGGEVLDLLQALNTGHRGALGTVHANSARDALKRLELLCVLQNSQLNPGAVRQLIASSLDLIVYVEKRDSLRQISEISRLEGLEGDTLLLRPLKE